MHRREEDSALSPGVVQSSDFFFDGVAAIRLSRLRHEVRLEIFRRIFAQGGYHGVIRPEHRAEVIVCEYAGAVSYLDAAD